MVHSANDEPDAVRGYHLAGADGCVGKAPNSVSVLIAQIASAYHRRADRRARAGNCVQRANRRACPTQ